MASWWSRPESLNLANKKKLTEKILQYETNVACIEEKILLILANVHDWKVHAKNLVELSNKHRLTAKHLVQLRPVLEQVEGFQKALDNLTSAEFQMQPIHEEKHTPHS